MTLTQRLSLAGGLLLCGLGLPSPSFAITGCSNGYLIGAYNAQVSSAAFTNVVGMFNAVGAPASTGSGSGSAGSAGPTTGGGLVGTATSLSGNMPALGRFSFDGNGNILGSNPNGEVIVGTYNVNGDCSATFKLSAGQAYSAVLVNQGQQVLFVESDANGNGATGVLQRSETVCSQSTSPQSFGFSYYGANPAASSTGSTGTGSTSSTTLQAFATVGTLNLDGGGNFSMTSYTFANGALQTQTNTGTYGIGANCGISLTFAANKSASASATVPAISGLLTDTGSGSGLITVQGSQGALTTGTVIAQ